MYKFTAKRKQFLWRSLRVLAVKVPSLPPDFIAACDLLLASYKVFDLFPRLLLHVGIGNCSVQGN